MRIKNIDMENFKPLVCVPIVDESVDKSLQTARALVDDKVKVIEWRLDYLRELSSPVSLDKALKEMADICSSTVLIATIRTDKEGGKVPFDEGKMKSYLSLIAKSKACDFVDVEYFTYENPRDVVSALKRLEQNVICSHHDFEETPQDDTTFSLLEEMDCSECDIVKMAVMPQTTTDVTRFMDISNAFATHTNKLVITMSMGKLGRASRLSADVTGSCVTFGSYLKASAPGQIDYRRLKEIINPD